MMMLRRRALLVCSHSQNVKNHWGQQQSRWLKRRLLLWPRVRPSKKAAERPTAEVIKRTALRFMHAKQFE